MLIPYYQVKLDCLQQIFVPDLAVKLPSWWNEVELPYEFLNVIPPGVDYRGSYVGIYPGYDTVLRTEWACYVARRLIYEALVGAF